MGTRFSSQNFDFPAKNKYFSSRFIFGKDFPAKVVILRIDGKRKKDCEKQQNPSPFENKKHRIIELF